MQIENESSRIYLVVGRSQNGKSTLIKYFANLDSNEIEIGDGGGISTTSVLRIYRSKKPELEGFSFIDCPGWDENRTFIQDSVLKENLERNLLDFTLKNPTFSLAGVILIDSLADSANFIKNNLGYLKNIFGILPHKSIAIILTKSDTANRYGMDIKAKLDAIKQEMETQSIPSERLMEFLAPYEYIDPLVKCEEQIPQLIYLLLKLEPIKLQSIKRKKTFIYDRALEIQEKEMIASLVSVEVQKVKFTDEQKEIVIKEAYTEKKQVPTIIKRVVEETYNDYRIVTKIADVEKDVPVEKEVSGRWHERLFNIKRYAIVYEKRTVKEEKDVVEQFERTRQVEKVTVINEDVEINHEAEKIVMTEKIPEIYTDIEKLEVKVKKHFDDCLRKAYEEFKKGILKIPDNLKASLRKS